jgi:hypothetical protein
MSSPKHVLDYLCFQEYFLGNEEGALDPNDHPERTGLITRALHQVTRITRENSPAPQSKPGQTPARAWLH